MHKPKMSKRAPGRIFQYSFKTAAYAQGIHQNISGFPH